MQAEFKTALAAIVAEFRTALLAVQASFVTSLSGLTAEVLAFVEDTGGCAGDGFDFSCAESSVYLGVI